MINYNVDIKTKGNPMDWYNKHFDNFKNLFNKYGITIGKIKNVSSANKMISFFVEKVDFNNPKVKEFLNKSLQLNDLSALPLATLPLLKTIGIVLTSITALILGKKLLDKFEVVSVSVKETATAILSPINVIFGTAIIFFLSGGLKLFKKNK